MVKDCEVLVEVSCERGEGGGDFGFRSGWGGLAGGGEAGAGEEVRDGGYAEAFVEERFESLARETVVDVGRKLNIESVHNLLVVIEVGYLVCDQPSHVPLCSPQCSEALGKVELDIIPLAFHAHPQ